MQSPKRRQQLAVRLLTAIAKQLVRVHGVSDFSCSQEIQRHSFHRAARHPVKLFDVGPAGALNAAIQLRGRGAARATRANCVGRPARIQRRTRCLHRPALLGWGTASVAGDCRETVAGAAVARVCASRTAQRETTSRAAKRFQITRRSGRTSTWTRSPGAKAHIPWVFSRRRDADAACDAGGASRSGEARQDAALLRVLQNAPDHRDR